MGVRDVVTDQTQHIDTSTATGTSAAAVTASTAATAGTPGAAAAAAAATGHCYAWRERKRRQSNQVEEAFHDRGDRTWLATKVAEHGELEQTGSEPLATATTGGRGCGYATGTIGRFHRCRGYCGPASASARSTSRPSYLGADELDNGVEIAQPPEVAVVAHLLRLVDSVVRVGEALEVAFQLRGADHPPRGLCEVLFRRGGAVEIHGAIHLRGVLNGHHTPDNNNNNINNTQERQVDIT